MEAKDKWDSTRGPVHSTPKGEGAHTAGQDAELSSIEDGGGGSAGRGPPPHSTQYRQVSLGASLGTLTARTSQS